ncbi:MAG TPA: ArsA family ATPase, partial [Candidatus Brocadiaceae bacterium]|nr:ArsA family ATPase [Candidatus Brocadiaceae bacterium]
MQAPSFLTNSTLSLICFGGKGGVGKTTSAAATALFLADKNPNKRVLLASIDPAHSLMDSLKGTNDLKNLAVWEIDARVSFQKFTEKYIDTLKKILDRGSFLDEADVCDLLSISLPGIDEVMGMIELVDLAESNVYDVIVLDTAPTGHTIKFLEMPRLIQQWVRTLDLMMEKHRYLSKLYLRCYQPDDTDAFIEMFTRGAEKVEDMLQDGSCEFVPVMVPEALSVSETRRFLSVLERHKIPVKNIVVNRVYPVDGCDFCNKQYALQKEYIAGMKQQFTGYTFLTMSLCEEEVCGKESLLKFAHEMTDTAHQNYRAGNHKIETTIPSHITGKLLVEGSCVGTLRRFECPSLLRFPVSSFHASADATEEGEDLPKKEFTDHFFTPKHTLEFFLFGGKGGVGKTTIASATALLLSERHPKKRILLFSTDPAHSLSDCLNVVVGDDGLALRKNLSILEMDAKKEYHKLKQIYVKEVRSLVSSLVKKDAAVQVVFENEIIESLMDIAPPGIDEIMALTRIIDYLDKGSFDIMILDTAPTGHLIRFLEMPELALSWLKFFFTLFLKYKNTFRMPKLTAYLINLSKNIKTLLALLRDGERSLFIPITIPTGMAFEETKDLVGAVRKLKIPMNHIIINMVQPTPQENAAHGECPLCRKRIAYEEKMLQSFHNMFPTESVCIVPKQENKVVGIEALRLLGK